MNRIIAIEGFSGSGKSTLINELLDRNSYYLVQELSRKYDPLKEFPKFRVETEEAIKANKWFVEREVERCDEARKFQQISNVIADRWYFSIFAVSYARHKLFGTEDRIGLNLLVERLLNEKRLVIPQVYVIDVPISIALDRLYKKYGGNTDKMRQLNIYEKFLREQKEFYLSLAEEKSFPVLDGQKDKMLLVKYMEEKIRS